MVYMGPDSRLPTTRCRINGFTRRARVRDGSDESHSVEGGTYKGSILYKSHNDLEKLVMLDAYMLQFLSTYMEHHTNIMILLEMPIRFNFYIKYHHEY